jgi:hypothetical protein
MHMSFSPRSIAGALFLQLAVLAATGASAQEREFDRSRDSAAPRSTTAQAEQPAAFGGLSAPYVRIAALIDAGGAPIRTKGVQSIQRISNGVYCIRPSISINLSTAITIVSVDYYYSAYDEAMVQTASAGSGCGAGRFGIYTLGDPDHDGNYAFSNGVAFSFIVP